MSDPTSDLLPLDLEIAIGLLRGLLQNPKSKIDDPALALCALRQAQDLLDLYNAQAEANTDVSSHAHH